MRTLAGYWTFLAYPLLITGVLALIFGAIPMALAAGILLLITLAGWLVGTLRNASSRLDRILASSSPTNVDVDVAS
ncbi:hypothetical protein [Lentzea sp. NBRC 105346]|uniref:hypothetical protein n=1 Tax=Lentzea sp. NBRC 105346 TaxID=3032205 RepID=UPI002555E02B|nr:hypothetical protein [Lentzea sp. NBRC 105346]